MKKLEIIIKPEKLESLKNILNDCEASGLMITNIMGYGNQKGYTRMYRGTTYNVNLLPTTSKMLFVSVPASAVQMLFNIRFRQSDNILFGFSFETFCMF